MCSMLFLWPFNMNILYIYIWVYMQKFLSWYSIRDENTTTMLEWTFLVWSHIPHRIGKTQRTWSLAPWDWNIFQNRAFLFKKKQLTSSCFLVIFFFLSFFLSRACVCLCNNEREIKCFSLFVNLPDHGNGRFCVLKLVATSRWNCALERKVWMSERRRGARREIQSERKSEWFKNVTSMRKFSGIFLTMHLASCYSFKVTLNSCFVLCCKQFLFCFFKKDAICLCIKRRGVLTGAVSPFCQYIESTQDMFIPQINIEIFFFFNMFPLYFWSSKVY